MIYQSWEINSVNVIMGLALGFGLALFMTYLTYKNIEAFLGYLLMFNGFMVYGNLLPSWVLILNIIVIVVIIVVELKSERGLI